MSADTKELIKTHCDKHERDGRAQFSIAGIRSLLDRIASLEAALAETEKQRDNLWMAYLHSQRCFHGGVGSTNPDQRAYDDVDRAVNGNGPKDCLALAVAKRAGRRAARLSTSKQKVPGE
jgi:hypothetical protein